MANQTLLGMISCAALAAITACSGGGSSSSATSTTPATSGASSGSTSTPTVTAASVALTAATYSATASGNATISIDRSGSANGAISVSYTTVNGSAVAGKDFTSVSGTLSWVSGETGAKAVHIPVSTAGGGKNFAVSLTKATGASIKVPSEATVMIATAYTFTGVGDPSLSVRVQGDHFIDANSVNLQLRGVNLSGLEFVAVQGWDARDPWGGMAPDFNAIKSWKSNTVRVPLNEASWLGYPCVDAKGATRNPDPGSNYQATVEKAVSDATAAGLYVILDLHWTAPKNFCPLAQNPMADADNSIAFWTSIADRFKGYPNVLFELFNEPYLFWLGKSEKDWHVLMQGGAETAFVTGSAAIYTANYSWQVAGMQQMLNAIRATGATNVVLVAGVSWAQDLSQWVANAPADPLKQIAAVWHAYPNSGKVGNPQAAQPKFGKIGYTWTQSVLSAGFPVLITEFGDHNAAGTVGAPFVSNLLPWADAHGASYTGWAWDPWADSDNVLIKDLAGTPTDGYGVYTKAHYLCVATGSGNCL